MAVALELLEHGIARPIHDNLRTRNNHDARGQGQDAGFVGDDDHGLAFLGFFGQHFQAAAFLLIVHGGGGFVEQQHIGVGQHQPGKGHQLFLPARQAFAAFHDGAVQAFGVGGDDFVHARALHGLHDGLITWVGQADEQVFTQAALEKAVVLLQVANVFVDHLTVDVGDVQAIEQDLPLGRVVQAAEQTQQGGLASPNGAQHRHTLTRLDLQLGHGQGRRVVTISKLGLLELVVATQGFGGEGPFHVLLVHLELVEFFQAFECGLGMGVLHQHARNGHDRRQNAPADDGASDQGAHGHLPLHDHPGPCHHQTGVADLLDGGRQKAHTFGQGAHLEVVLDGFLVDLDPAREEFPAARARFDGFDAFDRLDQQAGFHVGKLCPSLRLVEDFVADGHADVQGQQAKHQGHCRHQGVANEQYDHHEQHPQGQVN